MESSPKNAWFVRPWPSSEAGMHLFLFPYAGGGPPAFGKWPAELPATIDAYFVHYPGRGSRYQEPPLKRIDAFTENLSLAIKPLLDKPFAFFGHSLGGLVAFELARQLRRRDLPGPQMLFVSACGAPESPDLGPPLHALPDREFLTALQELNGLPAEVRNAPKLMEMFLPALRADFEASETYQYKPDGCSLECPVIAFGGLDDPLVSRERLAGWAAYTQNGFKVRYFPGDHFFIHTDRAAVIAAITSELISSHAKS